MTSIGCVVSVIVLPPRHMFPITYSVGDTLEGYKTLKKLASSRHHIVPGHDPEVVKLYPAAKPGLENWVVRLDAEPKV